MKPENEKVFFDEVDRSRYRSNWSCLIWFFVLCLAFLGIGWYFFFARA